MANKFYVYEDDAGNQHALQSDDALIALTDDIVKTYTGTLSTVGAATVPTAYDTFDDIDAAFPGILAKPSSIQVRGLNLQASASFGSAFLPVMKTRVVLAGTDLSGGDFQLTIENLTAAGAPTPFPAALAGITGDITAVLTGYRGESRQSN